MRSYRIWIDARAQVTRAQLKERAIHDLGCGRWQLHLSEEEHEFLISNNPEFNMNEFVKSKESGAFKVQV